MSDRGSRGDLYHSRAVRSETVYLMGTFEA